MLVYSDSMPITDAYIVKLYKKLLELTGLFSQVYNITLATCIKYLYHCVLLVHPLYQYCKHGDSKGEHACMPRFPKSWLTLSVFSSFYIHPH